MSQTPLTACWKKVFKALNNVKPILFALLSASLFATLPVAAEYQRLDGIVAIVDEDIITESDLQQKMQMVLDNLQQQNMPMPPEDEIRKQVMDRLILENLQLQMAQHSGITISDERLNQTMNNIAARNGFDLAGFREELLRQGLDYNIMRQQIRNEMIIQQVQQGNLRNRIQISDQEIANYLKSAEGQRVTATRYHLAHILLAVDEEASAQQQEAARQALSAIRHQVLQGQLDFKQLVRGSTVDNHTVSGTDFGWQEAADMPSLFADIATGMDTGDISEPIRSGAGWHLLWLAEKSGGSQLVDQVHARHILVMPSEVRSPEQAKALATRLYERALQGEDFSLLAKEYSEDKGSALQGGDLGWTGPGQFVPEFEQTLNALGIDEISMPVESTFGWHIIQKLGQRSHDMTQENWKAQAQQAIYERKFADELDAWLVRIREEAFVELK